MTAGNGGSAAERGELLNPRVSLYQSCALLYLAFGFIQAVNRNVSFLYKREFSSVWK